MTRVSCRTVLRELLLLDRSRSQATIEKKIMYKNYFALFNTLYLFPDLLIFRFDKMAPWFLYEPCVYKN